MVSHNLTTVVTKLYICLAVPWFYTVESGVAKAESIPRRPQIEGRHFATKWDGQTYKWGGYDTRSLLVEPPLVCVLILSALV